MVVGVSFPTKLNELFKKVLNGASDQAAADSKKQMSLLRARVNRGNTCWARSGPIAEGPHSYGDVRLG